MSEADFVTVEKLAPGFWRVTARYGFMQKPDIPGLLKEAHDKGAPFAFDDTTYYVGHETIVPREDGKGHSGWETALYAAMQRNAVHVSDFLHLPSDNVVEIGRQVAI